MDCRIKSIKSGNDDMVAAHRENAPLATADETRIAAARKAKIKVRRI